MDNGPLHFPAIHVSQRIAPLILAVLPDGADSSMRTAAFAAGTARRSSAVVHFVAAIPLSRWFGFAPVTYEIAMSSNIEEGNAVRRDVEHLMIGSSTAWTFDAVAACGHGNLRRVVQELHPDTLIVPAHSERRWRHVIDGLMKSVTCPITMVP